MVEPRLISVDAPTDAPDPAAELAAGLCEQPARVSPKFFYDALGSRLFEAITELPEYYPTRVEREIFDAQAPAMATAIGPVHTLVDLGAGSCRKAARLFPVLRPSSYVAVDISVDYLRDVLADLQREFPAIRMLGVGLDFSRRLSLPDALGDGPKLLFYPGSSIGNFTPAEALVFLRQCRTAAAGGSLLIGVDLVKPKPVLELAYDDPLGVTAAFNRNLLRRLNSLLGCDARLDDFDHVALFDERESRIEMHLQARRELVLRWPGGQRRLAEGERIHTENSYKYSVEGFAALLREAGFSQSTCWTDAQRWFAVFHAAV
jgi:dimethylhistidine N-methyltransferase